MIIGVSGRKSSGKDSTFKYIKELIPSILLFKFSKSLKYFCKEMFGLSNIQLNGSEEDKNSLTEIFWENFPIPAYMLANGEVRTFTGGYMEAVQANYHEIVNMILSSPSVERSSTLACHSPVRMSGRMTSRQVQQFFAELCRKMDPDCFLRKTLKDIDDYSPSNFYPVCITDVRYMNEVQAIQKSGGKVIRLLRQIDDDKHQSETELDGYVDFDCLIDNQNMSLESKNQYIKSALQTWGLIK